jgi:glycerol-3-phosphate dehydrogenase
LSSSADADVAVVGAGVVGAAVAHALVARGATVAILEAEPEPALGASGTNSGILHTGFDSYMGELETQLILRSGELRRTLLERLGVPAIRCGALVRPGGEEEARTVAALADGARRNDVDATLHDDGSLEVPGEAVTDPVAYTRALIGAAVAGGAEVRTGAPVEALEQDGEALVVHTADGGRVRCRAAVNCAGLRADEVARLAGDGSFEIYPRKGEFFVFEPPAGVRRDRILLPVPSERTKGVLVFPTVDGKVVAGPTAHDQEDKGDWSVRPDAFGEIMPKAVAMLPALEGVDPIASYAGLRPAGRGCNYVIGASRGLPGLINVAAIRSTGLSASLGIGEHVAALVVAAGVELGDPAELPAQAAPDPERDPWWLRASRREVAR